MTKPKRYLFRMVMFLLIVLAVGVALFPALQDAFMANAALNGMILGCLFIGIGVAFRGVGALGSGAAWIDDFQRRNLAPPSEGPPRLLAPMAALLGDTKGGRLRLSGAGLRTILDGIASRLDEEREITRYLVGLLVFLGLLGTFWGLMQTVGSVSNVIANLSAGGAGAPTAFEDLKAGLRSPLDGMGTAFSSSLFGLAGSLILGFMSLILGQAQNRFYNDLEEWLSGATRVTGGVVGESEGGVSAFVEALLEQMADHLEALGRTLTRNEEGRIEFSRQLYALNDRLSALAETMRTEQTLMLKLAEAQMELKPILARLAERPAGESASTAHLRNVEAYLARIANEITTGRVQSVQDIRNEIRLLARTIAALPEE